MDEKHVDTADLSKSMVLDVMRQCNNDADKANTMLEEISRSAVEDRQKKVKELARIFPKIADKTALLESTLRDCDWNVEKAIAPLFQMTDKMEQEEKKKKKDAEKKKEEAEIREKKKNAQKQANAFLKSLFASVPENKIQKILDQNQGDIGATTDILLQMVQKEEEAQKKSKGGEEKWKKAKEEEAQRARQQKLDALHKEFDAFELGVVEAVLVKNNWDMESSAKDMLLMDNDRKNEAMTRAYQDTSECKEKEKEEEQWETAKKGRRSKSKKRYVWQQKVDERDLQLKAVELAKELERAMQHDDEEKGKMDAKQVFKNELEEKIRHGPDNLPGFLPLGPTTARPAGPVPDASKTEEKTGKTSTLANSLTNSLTLSDSITSPPSFATSTSTSTSTSAPSPVGTFEVLDSTGIRMTLIATPDVTDVITGSMTVKWSALVVTSKDNVVSSDVTVGGNHDWVGLYKVSSADKRDIKEEDRITWDWTAGKTGSTKPEEMLTGLMQFAIPATFGHYIFAYFSTNKKGEYVRVATSNTVTVGPVYRMTATPLADEAGKDMTVTVSVSQLSGLEYATAWIGMYEKNETDPKQYKDWQWLTSAKIVDMNEKTKTQELTFKAAKSGEWEFRLFPLRAYIHTTTAQLTLKGSDAINISVNGAELTVTANIVTVDPLSEYVWVGVYKVDEQNNRQWRRYQYITSAGKTSIVFKTPIHTGVYEARLFAKKSYDVLQRSNAIAIQGI